MLFLVVSVNCFQENCYLALMEYSHSWDVTVTSGDVKESSSRVLIIHKYKCIRYMHIFLTDSVRPCTNVLQLALRPLFLLGSLFCQPSPQGPSGEKGPIGLSLGIRGRRSPTRRLVFKSFGYLGALRVNVGRPESPGAASPAESLVVDLARKGGAGGVRSVYPRVSKDVYMCRKRLALSRACALSCLRRLAFVY